MRLPVLSVVVCLEVVAGAVAADPTVHLRANQVGYLPDETKIAVAFSATPVTGTFSLWGDAATSVAFTGEIVKSPASGWDGFAHYYLLDFSHFNVPGRYRVRIDATGDQSRPFTIGETAYGDFVEELLRFLRQQRCGYNPVLDCVCHQRDGARHMGRCRRATSSMPAAGGTTPGIN